jgi:MSHA pilin protein MshA
MAASGVEVLRGTYATQQGFTLVELILVIVILGVLAATALPKFINARDDAANAAVKGVAGAAGSAMSLNHLGCATTNNVLTANKCARVNTCASNTVAPLLQAWLPTGFATAAKPGFANLTSTNGDTTTCTVTYVSGSQTYTADFVGISAGN